MHYLNLFVAMLLILPDVKGQDLVNPSFEGPTGSATTPPGWYACHPLSTPDTGPVHSLNCTTPAAHGSTYLALVTRGPLGPFAYTTEDCGAELSSPLIPGTTYTLGMRLARSPTYGHDTWEYGWIAYNTPARLRIWCGSGSCERQILLADILVDNVGWSRYENEISVPIDNCNELILEAWYDQYPEYFGNVLIDDLSIDPAAEFPNVISPNHDGHNDVLHFGSKRPGDLKVFDRWGNIVFEKANYQNNWDARDLSDGVYYYILRDRNGVARSSTLQILR
jgi:gliding motility-associated-like protein